MKKCTLLPKRKKARSASLRAQRPPNGSAHTVILHPRVTEAGVLPPNTHPNNSNNGNASHLPFIARNEWSSSDALQIYLREAGEVKLLTPEEEIELAARIKKGDEKAREHMIRANLRFVIKIARDYEGCGLPLLDLISEGNIGLMKGVERFDPAKGGKLTTYAAWWIKQHITKALANQARTIRIPIHAVDRLVKIDRVARCLEEEIGRTPTDGEISKEMGMPVDKITPLRVVGTKPLSLDQSMGDTDESATLGEVIGDENAKASSDHVEWGDTKGMLEEFVNSLSPRESMVIEYRFGLNGRNLHTLEDLGKMISVTRERVRQIQNIALQKLRWMIKNRERVLTPN